MNAGSQPTRSITRHVASGRRHRLLAAEARVLTFAPLASVALRAPELMSEGRFETLTFEALAATALAVIMAVAFRISSAIIGT
jgi:hypothetical protein